MEGPVICCVMPAAGGGSVFLVIMAAVAAVEGMEWALARIWWILGTAAVIAALAVAAMVPLMRWARRRDAQPVALWRGEAPARLRAEPVTELPRTERPAIAPAVINLNFYGVPADERATIIRTAIEGNEPS